MGITRFQLVGDPYKTCVICGESKLQIEHFIPNCSPIRGRPDLPRTTHDACKGCESVTKRAAYDLRIERNKAYKKFCAEQSVAKRGTK